jgi:hypothetical protein
VWVRSGNDSVFEDRQYPCIYMIQRHTC